MRHMNNGVFAGVLAALSLVSLPMVGCGKSDDAPKAGEKKKKTEAGKMSVEEEKARRAKTAEAVDNLDKIYKAATYYFQDPKNDPERPDKRLACYFPDTIPCTPAKDACASPDKKLPGGPASTWDAWAALAFEIKEPHYYQYCFESSGVGATARFKATAIGDLDCDGVKSTFTREGKGVKAVEAECVVARPSPIKKVNELE